MRLIMCQNVDCRPHTTHTRTDSCHSFPNCLPFSPRNWTLISHWIYYLKLKRFAAKLKNLYSTNHFGHWTWTVDKHTNNIQIHKICGKSVSRFLSFRLSIVNLNYTIHKMLTHMESNASVNFSNEMKNSKSRIVNLWLSLSTHLHFSFTLSVSIAMA